MALLAAAPERLRRVVVVGASAGLVDGELREMRAADDRRLARRLLNIGVAAFIAEWETKPLMRSQSAIHPAHLGTVRGVYRSRVSSKLVASDTV